MGQSIAQTNSDKKWTNNPHKIINKSLTLISSKKNPWLNNDADKLLKTVLKNSHHCCGCCHHRYKIHSLLKKSKKNKKMPPLFNEYFGAANSQFLPLDKIDRITQMQYRQTHSNNDDDNINAEYNNFLKQFFGK